MSVDADAEKAAEQPLDAGTDVNEPAPQASKEQLRSKKTWNLLDKSQPPILLGFRSHVNFITFVVGYGVFVDLCIYGIVSPVAPFRLEALGYDNVNALTGWLVAAYGGGLIVSSPPIGYLGERIKNRQVPLLVSLLFMIGSLIMFMLSKTFTLLVISRVLQGISGTGIFSLGFALLADCVPEDRLAQATGYTFIGMSVGGLLGPPLGGILYEKLGYLAPWIFSIILVVIDMAFRLCIIEPHQAAKWIQPSSVKDEEGNQITPARNERKESKAKAFLAILVNGRLLAGGAVSFAFGVYFGGVLDAAMTLRLNQRYGLNSLGAGLVFIANAIPSALIGPLAGYMTDRYGPRWVAFTGTALICPVLALLCIDKMPLAGFIVVLGGIGIVGGIPMPATSADMAIAARETPGLGFAHVFSWWNLAFSVGAFIGPIISGQVLEGLGTERGWYTMIGITVAVYLACVPFLFFKYPTKKQIDAVQSVRLAQGQAAEGSAP